MPRRGRLVPAHYPSSLLSSEVTASVCGARHPCVSGRHSWELSRCPLSTREPPPGDPEILSRFAEANDEA